MFIFFVSPQYTQVKEMEKQSTELEGVLKNARKLQELRDDLLEKQQNISASNIDRLEKLIPENSDNVKLVLEFQNIAEQYDLEIKTASSTKTEDEEAAGQVFDIETRDYGVITIDFTLEGRYADFINFLRSIEENIRISDVKSLSIAKEGGNDFENYIYTLSLDTYWLKDNI